MIRRLASLTSPLLLTTLACDAQLGPEPAEDPDLGSSQVFCEQGFAFCGNDCVDLNANPTHCGACDSICEPGTTCQAGTCGTAPDCTTGTCTCLTGQTKCGDVCVSTQSNQQHCGTCNSACSEGQNCVDGVCGAEPDCTGDICSCEADEEVCGELCINTTTNPQHCGACGAPCAEGQVCVAGACVCPAGTELCDAGCVDVLTDDQNCGSCGNGCAEPRFCSSGSCACPEEAMVCGDECVDVTTDSEHCGECDNACASYEACQQGVCKFDEDQCGGAAVGVEMSEVLLYQAVQTELFTQGVEVAPQMRTVDVIADKDAMVRVFVETDPGFQGRTLSARVFVQNDGQVDAFFDKKLVSQASVQGNLSTTLNIEIPGDRITTHTEYWVELVECGVPPMGEVGTVRYPETATSALGAVETGVIKVAFLPVSHDGRTPDTSEETVEQFARDVERHYPTSRVEARVLPEVTSNQAGIGVDWVGLLEGRLRPLRGSLGVDNDEYVYGLINPADDFASYCRYFGQGGCTTGIAYVVDQLGFGAAPYRVGVGVGYPQQGVGTFTHELGHNHGQCHAPCGVVDNPGDACDVDPNYPYNQAAIGVWGYDFLEGTLKNPNEYADFMSYCSPAWVSDYAYNRYTSRISDLNQPTASMNLEGPGSETVQWERIVVTAQGARWLSPLSGPQRLFSQSKKGLVYDAGGQVAAEVDVYQVHLSEGFGYVLHVPPAQPGWFAVGLKGDVALPY